MLTAKQLNRDVERLENDRWDDPLPLPDSFLEVSDFDYRLLPERFRPWAQDICERIQCSPDYVGAAMMAVLGSLVGRKVAIRPQQRTDWMEVPNQWAMLIGRPGVLKSPATEAVLAPLKLLSAKAHERYELEQSDYTQLQKVNKLKAEENEKAARKLLKDDPGADISDLLIEDKLEIPTLKRYITNDTTAAGLGELLRQNHNGLLIHRDELVSLLRMLDREDSADARGFYLTGWNGNSAYTIDRIGRGMNLHIPAVCLSMLGSTQPGKISSYLRMAVKGGVGDDGLIQRFGLLVWPNATGWKEVDQAPDVEGKKMAYDVIRHLDTLDPQAIGAYQDDETGNAYLRFDEAGLALFREWRTDLEAKLRGDIHPALESHLSKYRKLIPTLALIIHLADCKTGDVGEEATLQAVSWADYLETHARRAYGVVLHPDVETAKAIIHRMRKGDLPENFSSRDVWRPQWSRLSNSEEVNDALKLLVELNWLGVSTKLTNGRSATVYTVNPRGLK